MGGNFIAEVEIVSKVYEEFIHIEWAKNGKPYMFLYRVRIKIINEGMVHISYLVTQNNQHAIHSNPNFIDHIVFISDKGKTGSQYLQVSIVNINKDDFDTIASALKGIPHQ